MGAAYRTKAGRLRAYRAAEKRIGTTPEARARWLHAFVQTDLTSLDNAGCDRLGWEATAHAWKATCEPMTRAGDCAVCVGHPEGDCLSAESPQELYETQTLARARLAGLLTVAGRMAKAGG